MEWQIQVAVAVAITKLQALLIIQVQAAQEL
jgi:hypothetical protein